MPNAHNLGAVSTRLVSKHFEVHLRKFTPEVRARFLKKLEETCSVQMAADACYLRVAFLRLHKQHDPQLARDWEAALDRGFDPRNHPDYKESMP